MLSKIRTIPNVLYGIKSQSQKSHRAIILLYDTLQKAKRVQGWSIIRDYDTGEGVTSKSKHQEVWG